MKHYLHITTLLIVLMLLLPESAAAVNNMLVSGTVTQAGGTDYTGYIGQYTYAGFDGNGNNYWTRTSGGHTYYLYYAAGGGCNSWDIDYDTRDCNNNWLEFISGDGSQLPSSYVSPLAWTYNSAKINRTGTLSVTEVGATPVPEISITGNGNSITDGSISPSFTNYTKFGSQNYSSGSVTRTYTISNTGTGALTITSVSLSGTNANQFSITQPLSLTVSAGGSTTFTVTFDPSSAGMKDAIITVNNNDSDEGTYDFHIDGYGYTPANLGVTGITSPSAANTLYIHQGVLNGFEYWKSADNYYLYNDGATWNIDTDQNSASLLFYSANNSTSSSILDVTGWTGSPGAGATGTGTPVVTTATATPNINLKGNSTTIVINDATPSFSDYTKFGSVDVAAVDATGSRTRTYTIENTGGASLTSLVVTLGGTDAADFSKTDPASSSVAAYGSTTFTVTFNPSTSGTKTASVSIASNDPDENPYLFYISGDAFYQNNLVVSGITTPAAANGTYSYQGILNEFQYWKHISQNYYVYNSIYSNQLWWYIDTNQSSSTTNDFLFAKSSEVVAPVGLTGWTVGTGAAGTPSIVYASPEMDVRGNGISIVDGDAVPSSTDYTDFGSVSAVSGTISRTFTIYNTGYGSLSLSGSPIVAISGTNSSDFTVTTQPTSPVAATSGTTTFVVQFDPSGSGTRSATISIANNDSDENPYNFSIQGIGLVTPTVTNTTASSIAITSVTLGGNVTSDGGATVTERGVVYSLNSANTGPQIGGTGVTKVAYSSGGTGSFSQPISSLIAGTSYAYNAYATNTIGTSYGTASSFTTLYAAPTTQAFAVILTSDVAGTQLNISWTNGNGTSRTVFMKQGTGAITNPTDGSTYTASTDWSSKGTQLGSSGYSCIYNGTGNSVAVTNAIANTQYTAQVFEYNGTGSSSVFNTSTATGNPNNATSLPVELTSFTGSANGNTVTLNWATATEVNNYGFNVETRHASSLQGTSASVSASWGKLGFVQGHGNSNSPKSYSFIDANPVAGKVQYRLKQIDFDGKYEYSGVVEVKVAAPTNFSIKQNFPNPFNPSTTIQYVIPSVAKESTEIASSQQSGTRNDNVHVTLKVYDILGRVVATLVDGYKPAGSYVETFSGISLPSGMYFYKLTAGNFSETKKMLLMK